MKTCLEPEEVKRLEEAAANVRDRLLIRLLFHLGCRVSEALALAVEDIDLEQGTATIELLKVRTRLTCPECKARLGKTHAFCPQCGAPAETAVAEEREHRRLRTLPLDGESLDMLKHYIRRGGPVPREGRMLLFGISRHRARQVVTGCAERAGLGQLLNPETGRLHRVSPHRLRDAFAVHAVKRDDSGDGLRLLQQHLGHASFNTTAKYRKVSGQEHQAWYQKLWNGDRHNSEQGLSR